MLFGKKQEIGKIETIIGFRTEVKGPVVARGVIRVDGIVEGGISEAEGVVIGETGVVKGLIQGKNVIVGGKVVGNIQSDERLDILSTGELYGDIRATELSIAEGSYFEGACTMTKKKKDKEPPVERKRTGRSSPEMPLEETREELKEYEENEVS